MGSSGINAGNMGKISDEEDDDEMDADDGGELEDQSQESLEHQEHFSQDIVMDEPETPQGYPEGSSALEGLDLSESEDEPTDLVTAFEGPTDLFGNMSSSDEE